MLFQHRDVDLQFRYEDSIVKFNNVDFGAVVDPDIADNLGMHCLVVLTAFLIFGLYVDELNVDLARTADDVHRTEDHLVQMAIFKQICLVAQNVFNC